MAAPLRMIHYLNQFFGGIGGEDKADVGPSRRDGPVGPGLALAGLFREQATIVGTLICGDNYFIEHQDAAVAELLDLAASYDANVLIAGPAFSSGRYGTACGALSLAWQRQGKPAVTAMNVNNPGVELCRAEVYVLRTGPTAAAMLEVLPRLADLAVDLGRHDDIGAADAVGYFPRGLRRNLRLGVGAAERAVEMLLAKLAGRPYATELAIESFGRVPSPPPVPDLSQALVALVSESGLVPVGNPDRLETWNASKWFKYSITGLDRLEAGRFEAWHGGCDTTWTNQDPNRAVPLDAARQLERDSTIGRLYESYYVTTGNMANIKTMERIGHEMAQDMRAQGIQAVILTAT